MATVPETRYSRYVEVIKSDDGNDYGIYDYEARRAIEAIVGGLTFVKSTDAATTPQGVVWDNGGTAVTGTLIASASTADKIYLVPATTTSGKDVFAEYITVLDGGTYSWEKLGDTEIDFDSLGDLAWKDTVTLNKQSGKPITAVSIPTGTTWTQTPTKVTLDSDAFDVTTTTDTFVKTLSTTDGAAITGLGTPTTDNAVKSYTPSTGTFVTGVTPSTTAVVDSVTPTSSKLTTATGYFVGGTTTVKGVNANTSVTATKMSSYGTLPTWTETALTSGGSIYRLTYNSGALPAGSDVTATNTTTTNHTVATRASSTSTYATGSVAANSTGASIVTAVASTTDVNAVTSISAPTGSALTGLGTPTTFAAVKSYGSPTTANFLKTASAATSGSAVTSVVVTTDDGNGSAVQVVTNPGSISISSRSLTVTATTDYLKSTTSITVS